MEKGVSRAAVGKTIRKAATEEKEKMKCIENTFNFPSSCYCKTIKCCVDLLNLDEKYLILQGKYTYAKYIYRVAQ